ncbi:hypothetical protein Purlil1_1216 [Purpureocillium lilacinum]|uniref:Uncharacterized protein n=1 Tax=Purpureocillium lilacinum TaxID=33203 RepID=A0ABR0CF07_PURLI|nr:hypothetical protein Purlil1_1216 [Purpureocillium lilacinum]
MLGGERSAGMPQTRTNTPHSVNSGCCTLALHDSRSVRPLLPATGIVQRRHGILAARGLCRLERRAHGVESSHHSHHKVSAAAPAHPLGGGWGPLAFVAGHRWLLAGSAACFRFWALWPRAATTARKQLLPLSVSPPRRLRDGTVTWQRGRQAQCPPPHRLMHGRRRHGEMRELINVGRPPWAIANDYLGGPRRCLAAAPGGVGWWGSLSGSDEHGGQRAINGPVHPLCIHDRSRRLVRSSPITAACARARKPPVLVSLVLTAIARRHRRRPRQDVAVSTAS